MIAAHAEAWLVGLALAFVIAGLAMLGIACWRVAMLCWKG